MNFNKLVTVLIFSFSFSATGFAQGINISGIIEDAHTKEPVTFASVYFIKSGVGKTSDSAGNFSFYLNNITTDTIAISYTGYQLYKIPVTAFTNNKPLVIQLQRGGENNMVVVKSKFNKGLYLWKKIMSKKKQYNRSNLPNYAYEAYNKLEVDVKNFNSDKMKKRRILKPFSFVFDNIDSTSDIEPFLPLYLVESLSDYSYQRNPKKYYEYIKASNTKGLKNESVTKLLGVMDQNVNIYANYVNVMDKDFISPFNDDADVYYNFRVPDTQIVNNKKIFHFVFNPKHPGQNTFVGDAWVLEKTFQIQRISLYLGKEANINFIDRVSIFQEFIPINDTIYFLNRDKFFADFRVLGKNSLTLIGRKTTSYKNIVIDKPFITNYFKFQKLQELVKTAPQLTEKTDSAWNSIRHDTLSANEKAIYTTVDKLLEMPKFKKLQHTILFIGTGYKDIGNLQIGPWFNWVSSNILEGTRFRFDLGTNTGFNKNIYLHGYLAYGTKERQINGSNLTDSLLDINYGSGYNKFKGQLEAYWFLSRTPNWLRLHASYTDDIDNGVSQVGEVSQDNIFSVGIRKKGVSRKFLRVKDLRFEVLKDLGKGFSGELFIAHRQYDPLLNLPFSYFFTDKKGPSSLTNFEVAFKLRFAYLERFFESDYFRTSLGTKFPVIELMVSKGIKGVFNSSYDYTKVYAAVKDRIKIAPYGSFSYKVYGGLINKTLPFTYLENHPGNDLYYYNNNSFNLMNRFEYLSDKYAGVNIEHNIGSGIFRFIPITRKLKFRQFWNVKSLWGSLSKENYALNNTANIILNHPERVFKTLNNSAYVEVGTGIDNILKVFRVDLVWRLSPSSAPTASKFGIFGSFQLHF